MKRANGRQLPRIAVEEEAIGVRVALPAELHAELEQFAHYFAQAGGRKPLSLGHVIVGLLSGYLSDHPGFQDWKREQHGNGPSGSPFATPASPRAATRD